MTEIKTQKKEIKNPNTHNTLDNKLLDFSYNPEAEKIIKKNQLILDKQNSDTVNALYENIKYTKNNLNLWYINKNYSELWNITINENLITWNMSDILNYKTSNEINYLKTIKEHNIWYRLEYYKIELDRLKSDYDKIWQRLANWEISYTEANIEATNINNLLAQTKDNIYKIELENNEIDTTISKFESRKLTQYAIDLLDAINEQRSQNDLVNDQIFSDLTGNLLLNSTNNVDQINISPLDILKDKYLNSSEEEKILMARTITKYMYNNWYNIEDLNIKQDVSSEKIWSTYKKWWLAWVCRHHHSEVAKFLKSVWIESWIVSTNNWVAHVITWWKKSDWTFFMIDYWDYFEWKDPKELKEKYLALKWTIDFTERVADENWKVIWYIQTPLEKLFTNMTSSIWTWDSLDYSKNIASEWINISKWHNTELNINWNWSIGIDYSYWNWQIEWWVFFNQTKDIGSIAKADYSSYWLYFEGKKWNKENRFWEFWYWLKVSGNNFDWNNWKNSNYLALWVDWKYFKELYNKEKTKINLWWVLQWQIMQDPEEKNKKNYWFEGSISNFWATFNIDQKLSNNIEWKLNLLYWWDIWVKNIRVWRNSWIKVFDKKWIEWWLKYTTNNWDSISWDLQYEKWLWYTKKWLEVELKTWNLWVEVWYEKTNNSKNPFLLNEAKKYIWIIYDIKKIPLKINAWFEKIDNWINWNNTTSVWITYRF